MSLLVSWSRGHSARSSGCPVHRGGPAWRWVVGRWVDWAVLSGPLRSPHSSLWPGPGTHLTDMVVWLARGCRQLPRPSAVGVGPGMAGACSHPWQAPRGGRPGAHASPWPRGCSPAAPHTPASPASRFSEPVPARARSVLDTREVSAGSAPSEARPWLCPRGAAHQDPAWQGSRAGFGRVHRGGRMGAGRVPCQDAWEPGTGGWSAGGHRSVGATASPGGGVFTRREAVSGCRAAWPPPPPLWRVPWRCVRGAGQAPVGVRPLPSPTHSAGAMRPGAQPRPSLRGVGRHAPASGNR